MSASSAARRKGGREPKPWEEVWWWHSKPVAKSLHILDQLGALVREEGRTDKTPGLCPFSVEIRVTRWTPYPWAGSGHNGEPVKAYLPGDVFFVTHRRELHEVAQEALRRVEEAKNEEAP